MKPIFYTALIAVALFACNEEGEKTPTSASVSVAADSANYTQVQWIDSVKNVGELNYGQKAQIKFRFKNIGTKPLFIVNAEPGCGCTVAEYPKEAIAPGGEGEIVAGFETQNQHGGEFRKNINVTTNTNGSTGHTLIFTGTIKKEGDDEHASPVAVPLEDTAHKH